MMNVLVNVRNNVAASPTRPGIEDTGMINVIADINTIAITGQYDINMKGLMLRSIVMLNPAW